MKYILLLLLFSITPIYCLNQCGNFETGRKTILTKLAQDIFHMNKQIDQVTQHRERLIHLKEIAVTLKYIDQLKKDRDTKMRELHNLRDQSFIARLR